MSTPTNRHGLPLSRAAPRLHRLRGVPARLPRLRVRGVPLRHAARAPRSTGVTVMTTATPQRELMEGSEALARAAIAAGCRFFAGYPMTPFTEVLEHFARLLPDVGGVCINAESELEAVGMAWGALATGARAATGSTGQGLSLMQESFSEITLAELPLVDLQHGARPAGLLPGDARRRPRRLPPHRARTAGRARRRRARAARVPPRRQVAQPGAHLRRLPARAHAGGADDRDRSTFPTLPAEGLGGRRHRVGHRASRSR